jgi:thiopeptide-type bacteriocin biosynthesis protein
MSENQAKNNTKKIDIQRTFMIGEQWLYYKFYTGPKTTDVLLAEMIKPVTEHLLQQGAIDSWFFIRYSDPKLHTRVRFRIPQPQNIGPVIQLLKDNVTPFIQQNLVWKVQIDTYQREVERYGSNTMDISEDWFFHDSKMIVAMLAMIEGDEGERIRWLFALRAIDSLLADFQFTMEQKYELVTIMRENFGREHGMNRSLKSQMEKKYRADRKSIEELLNHKNDEVSEMLPLFQMIAQKSIAVQPIAQKILALKESDDLEMHFNDLMGSYSHMMINRLFKSKQRTHELVLYDFLHRYYKSEIARQKYSKINAKKKAEKK